MMTGLIFMVHQFSNITSLVTDAIKLLTLCNPINKLKLPELLKKTHSKKSFRKKG